MTPGRDGTTDLKPATIMAAHAQHRLGDFDSCVVTSNGPDTDQEPCGVYRLAAALAEANDHHIKMTRHDERLVKAERRRADAAEAALAAAQEREADERAKVQEVIAILDRVDPARSASIMLTAVYCAVGVSPHREARAALPEEGAAGQQG